MIMQGKYVLIYNSFDGVLMTRFMNQHYSIPFHLSEQKLFLYLKAIAMRKSLPKLITDKINRL